ncbi:putative spanin [Klebsiella phage vB_KpM_FBKp24]|uniref:Putative spanin n=1 Tax=Klebsiella phage vB_KpM_FBKp24 TaxID=2801834 RepID=A0A7U0GBL4_9CAUD|nr:hypothetical protein [Klebsiella pneumoniae]YP_010298996.1 putative spanin [Klebsiella phage vB_KpM_FBKp24]QQV92139.1 putative spanin [Klebsiella phage vB_KpM_FBKp24]
MWTTLAGNRYFRCLIVILLIMLLVFGIYQAGKYVQKKINDTVAQVTNQITKNVQESLQKSLNEQMGGLQNQIDNNFSSINGKFDEQQQSINDTKLKLNNIGDVWLRVERVRTDAEHVSNAKGTGSKSTGSSGGSDGTYYAKLPDSNVQFLKGEAFRADQCAVRLGAAQQVIVQYKGAFEKYQSLVATYLAAAQIGEQTK